MSKNRVLGISADITVTIPQQSRTRMSDAVLAHGVGARCLRAAEAAADTRRGGRGVIASPVPLKKNIPPTLFIGGARGVGVIFKNGFTPRQRRQAFLQVQPVGHGHHPLGYGVPGCIRSHVSWPGWHRTSRLAMTDATCSHSTVPQLEHSK